VEIWEKEGLSEEEKEEDSVANEPELDEKEAYRLAGKKAQEIFIGFCRALPEKAQRNIRLDALERYPFELMVQHGLIKLVSSGTYNVPVWYLISDGSTIKVNSLDLKVIRL